MLFQEKGDRFYRGFRVNFEMKANFGFRSVLGVFGVKDSEYDIRFGLWSSRPEVVENFHVSLLMVF